MKTLLILFVVSVSLATSACTTTYSQGYSYTPYRASASFSYNCERQYHPVRPYRQYYSVEQEPLLVGPQYYKSNVPCFPGNVKNYTGVPVVAPNAYNPQSNLIIPNSWN